MLSSAHDSLDITLGVEEESFLINPKTLDLLSNPDSKIFEHCEANAGDHKVVREFLRSQIETNTRVCNSVAEVRQSMIETRKLIAEAASIHGVGVMSASMHPFARWQDQNHTPRKRYETFSVIYQETFRRFLIGGMHIHAGFGNPDSRIQVMNSLRRYLPILLALSTSSPFMEGRETGYKSARLNVWSTLPRVGIPRRFQSYSDYETLVSEFTRRKFIGNSSEIWWDIRPSNTYPTIELRICDVCSRIDDLMAIVAFYASLIRYSLRHHPDESDSRDELAEIITENKWQVQRYGIFAFLADPHTGARLDIDDIVRTLVTLLHEDAVALDCVSELQHALTIIKHGSSADRQLDHYRLCLLNGASTDDALRAVVQLILRENAEGVD